MSTPSWSELEVLFHEALARAPDDRALFLAERCAGRLDLQAEVEALLRAHERTASALEVPLTLQTQLKAGVRFGAYDVLSEVGAGGMGEVYRARDTKLGRDVAIKILPQVFVADPERLARFDREARVLASLNHPHILTVHDAGQLDGRQYLVSEFIDGGTLRDWVRDTRPTWRQTLELLTGVADGLACAHEAGILHRDVKPDNILVTKSGYAKVADFGLAKLASAPEGEVTGAPPAGRTKAGAILGTVAYMSPEQASGKAMDARSDIFAFGVVLYETLAGRHPFEGTSDVERLHAVIHQPAPSLTEVSPDIAIALCAAVEKALEKDPADRYQSMRDLVVDLRRLTHQSAASADRLAPGAIHPKWVWRLSAATGTAVIVVAALMAGPATVDELRMELVPGAGEPRIRTIAVLPLRNISEDPDQEYFADGMTEVLTTSLAQISALNVIARTSAMRYRGTQKTTREIAQELHVDAVVEGAAQRSGDRVLITAQLIEGSTDRHLWARSYERDLRDTLALQNEVAQAIAQEIQVKLTPQEQVRLAGRRVVNAEAQEAYLRGVYWRTQGPGDFRRAYDYFQEAVARDPSYAAAYAALSNIYEPLIAQGALPAKEAAPKWRAAVTKALELDPALAEAYVSRGVLLYNLEFAWQDAERDFQRALQLDPNLANAHGWYAYHLAFLGRFDEAIIHIKRAVQLDPFSAANSGLAGVLLFAGRVDEAIDQAQKVFEVTPVVGQRQLGLAYEEKGNLDVAIGIFEQRLQHIDESFPPFPGAIGDLAHAYAVAGRRTDALRLLAQLHDISKRRFVNSWDFAIVYAGLGDKDRAFEAMEKGYDQRPSWMASLKVEPRMKPLRSDPRYQSILRRMGLSS